MSEQFELDTIDRLARIETKLDALEIERTNTHKLYGIGGLFGLIAGFISGLLSGYTGVGPSS